MMTALEKEIFEAVEDINSAIIDYHEEGPFLGLRSTGFATLVEYLGVVIFNTEDDTRHYIEKKDDYLPVKDHLVIEMRRVAVQVSSIYVVMEKAFPLVTVETEDGDKYQIIAEVTP